ncbi:MAG: DUF445 family protein [Bacillota bacterium]|nr:DUF445 family protein [Bacillota bacterium]
MIYQLILIPLISAFIGYVTNVFAIRLLFWPREPIKFVFFKVQGLLHKRQSEIAVKLGELVEQELLSLDDVFDKINTPEVQEKLIEKISELMKDRLVGLLPRIIPPKLTQIIIESLEKILRQEAPDIMERFIESGKEYLTQEIQISKIVEEKVKDYDLKELEDMIRGISIEELTFIEILGGVVGFVIGIVQVAILCLFPR